MDLRITCAVLSAAAAMGIAGSGRLGRAQGDPGGSRIAVWITCGEVRGDGVEAALEALAESGITLVEEGLAEPPDASHARETLAVYRAVAVVWHDDLGRLNLMVSRAGGVERVTASPGSPEEEALYVREVIEDRIGDGGDFAEDLLVTAPLEVPGEESPPPSAPPPETSAVSGDPAVEAPVVGPRLGAGYRLRLHCDAELWPENGVEILVPRWRLEEPFALDLAVVAGLPTRIGDEGRQFLEIQSVEVIAGAAWTHAIGSGLEMELGLGAGLVWSEATAFLSDRSVQSEDHVAGEIAAWAAIAWHVLPGLGARALLGMALALRPPSWSIGGRGDFGENPWQPFAGLDIDVALFGK